MIHGHAIRRGATRMPTICPRASIICPHLSTTQAHHVSTHGHDTALRSSTLGHEKPRGCPSTPIMGAHGYPSHASRPGHKQGNSRPRSSIMPGHIFTPRNSNASTTSGHNLRIVDTHKYAWNSTRLGYGRIWRPIVHIVALHTMQIGLPHTPTKCPREAFGYPHASRICPHLSTTHLHASPAFVHARPIRIHIRPAQVHACPQHAQLCPLRIQTPPRCMPTLVHNAPRYVHDTSPQAPTIRPPHLHACP